MTGDLQSKLTSHYGIESGLRRCPRVEGILKRAQGIVERGVTVEIMHGVLGYEGVALLLHNTATMNGKVLDEYLTTVCTLRGGKIARLDTHISDIPLVNEHFR